MILLPKRRNFTVFAFDPTHAHAIGLNPPMLGAFLLGLLALTLVVALQAVGVVLVVAMLIIPGATAHLPADRLGGMLVLASAISAACAVVGLYARYYFDADPGGMMVLAQGTAFALAYLFSPRHGPAAARLAAVRRTKRAAGTALQIAPAPYKENLVS